MAAKKIHFRNEAAERVAQARKSYSKSITLVKKAQKEMEELQSYDRSINYLLKERKNHLDIPRVGALVTDRMQQQSSAQKLNLHSPMGSHKKAAQSARKSQHSHQSNPNNLYQQNASAFLKRTKIGRDAVLMKHSSLFKKPLFSQAPSPRRSRAQRASLPLYLGDQQKHHQSTPALPISKFNSDSAHTRGLRIYEDDLSGDENSLELADQVNELRIRHAESDLVQLNEVSPDDEYFQQGKRTYNKDKMTYTSKVKANQKRNKNTACQKDQTPPPGREKQQSKRKESASSNSQQAKGISPVIQKAKKRATPYASILPKPIQRDQSDEKRTIDEIMDDKFDFIKFLDEVRERYNLSPTPLVVPAKIDPPRQQSSVESESREQLVNWTEEVDLQPNDTAEFESYWHEVVTAKTQNGIAMRPNIAVESHGTRESGKTTRSVKDKPLLSQTLEILAQEPKREQKLNYRKLFKPDLTRPVNYRNESSQQVVQTRSATMTESPQQQAMNAVRTTAPKLKQNQKRRTPITSLKRPFERNSASAENPSDSSEYSIENPIQPQQSLNRKSDLTTQQIVTQQKIAFEVDQDGESRSEMVQDTKSSHKKSKNSDICLPMSRGQQSKLLQQKNMMAIQAVQQTSNDYSFNSTSQNRLFTTHENSDSKHESVSLSDGQMSQLKDIWQRLKPTALASLAKDQSVNQMLARKANESLLNGGSESGAQNKLELQSNKSTSQDASQSIQSMGSEIKDIRSLLDIILVLLAGSNKVKLEEIISKAQQH